MRPMSVIARSFVTGALLMAQRQSPLDGPPTGTKVEVRGITIWRIVNGRIVEKWSSLSETGAYIRMLAHLQWWLLLAGLLVLAIVIAIERLVWRMVAKCSHIAGCNSQRPAAIDAP